MGATIFVEGETEEEMILWFHRLCRPETKIFYNHQEFRDWPSPQKSLLFTCDGCGDVLPKARLYKFLLTEGHNGKIIRDLEETTCFSGSTARGQLATFCPEYLAQPEKCALFANPRFEAVYAADTDLFNRVMLSHVTAQGGEIRDLALKVANINWRDPKLGRLFASLGLAFKKRELAKKYFSQFDFASSTHPYFVRLRVLIP